MSNVTDIAMTSQLRIIRYTSHVVTDIRWNWWRSTMMSSIVRNSVYLQPSKQKLSNKSSEVVQTSFYTNLKSNSLNLSSDTPSLWPYFVTSSLRFISWSCIISSLLLSSALWKISLYVIFLNFLAKFLCRFICELPYTLLHWVL